MLPPGYMILSDGRIYGPSGALLKQTPNAKGYAYIAGRGKGAKKYRACRLVCEAFNGPPPFPGAQARHIDGNPQNNRAANLQWGTNAENQADRIRHGTDNGGERNGMSLLTWAVMREIRKRVLDGESQTAVGRSVGISVQGINAIIRGRAWPDPTYTPPTARTRLTEEDMQAIRDQWATGNVRQVELATKYRVAKNTIWNIIHMYERKTYGNQG